MKTSPDGHRILEYFEGREHEAYPDPASPLAKARRNRQPTAGLSGAPWTIGVGHTGPEVHEGLVWTDEQIDAARDSDLLRFERAVDKFCAAKRVPTQGEFDALVLFAFNVGEDDDADTKAEGLGDSTLLRRYLAGDTMGAADEFPKWDKAQGERMLGLARRRVAERQRFLGRTAETAIGVAKLLQA